MVFGLSCGKANDLEKVYFLAKPLTHGSMGRSDHHGEWSARADGEDSYIPKSAIHSCTCFFIYLHHFKGPDIKELVGILR